jgi:DNA polymerase bacteriophage-type
MNLKRGSSKPWTNSSKYAKHSSTEVMCLGYCDVDYPKDRFLWRPGDPFPFYTEAGDTPNKFLAFNAGFELTVWNLCCVRRYGWPTLDPSRIDCLQARAAYIGLPRALDNISNVLAFGSAGKDSGGHQTMLRLTKPVGGQINSFATYVGGEFDQDPEKRSVMEDYCLQDIATERWLKDYVPPLPELERKTWLANHEINERGIPVDIPLAYKAFQMVQRQIKATNLQMGELTGGVLTSPTQTKVLKDWLNQHGVPVQDVRQETLKHIDADWLQQFPNCEEPKLVLDVLRGRELTRNAAVAKYRAVMCHADRDHRCRGQFIFYQAGTGRFQTSGVNFGNLARLSDDEVPDLIALADRISCGNVDELYQELQATKLGVIPTLAKLVRMVVKARPGHKLAVRDYSSIEMNMLHWLADDHKTLKYIADFYEGIGDEPYKIAAAQMYGVKIEDVDKNQRNAGKVYYLGSGYCASANTLAAFAKGYGLDLDYETAKQMVQDYRESNPLVVNLWYNYIRSSVRAVENPGKEYDVNGVTFRKEGPIFKIRLRSGRELCYYDPKVVQGKYGKEIECSFLSKSDRSKDGRRWLRITTIVENIDQATSRDLLTDALLKCRLEGLEVVLHVYDEIVIESPNNNVEKDVETLKQIMLSPPSWAKGLPLQVKGGISERYTK